MTVTTAQLRQALSDIGRAAEARFEADRAQIERLKREINSLKAELAECKRELRAVSPQSARYLKERRTKRKQPNYIELDLEPVRETRPKGLLGG